VALQGTIDAFPLTDVLQLLSSSARSGHLHLEGDRGRASLSIEAGAVVGGLGGRAGSSSAALMVMDMLRFTEGSFVFDAPDVAEAERMVPVEPVELADCVEQAAALLEQWQQIEAVVPSAAHRLALAEVLDDDSVVITGTEWPFLVAAGRGPTVEEVGSQFGLDEFECASAIAALVGRSLLTVVEPAAVDLDVRDLELESPPSPTSAEDEPETAFPDRFPIDDLVTADAAEPDAWSIEVPGAPSFAAAQTFEPLGGHDEVADGFAGLNGDLNAGLNDRLNDRTAEAWDEVVAAAGPARTEDTWAEPVVEPARALPADEPADEVLKQMSRLSPKAAEAIAAALGTAPAAPLPPADGPAGRDNEGPITYMGSF
jgi:hypothetical protein